jgi:hypothetical protein
MTNKRNFGLNRLHHPRKLTTAIKEMPARNHNEIVEILLITQKSAAPK